MKKVNYSILPKLVGKKSVGTRVVRHSGFCNVPSLSERKKAQERAELNRKIIELELKKTERPIDPIDEEYMYLLEERSFIYNLQQKELYCVRPFSSRYYFLRNRYEVPSCINKCWDEAPSKKKFEEMRQLCTDANYMQERGKYLLAYIKHLKAEFVPCLSDIKDELLKGASLNICDKKGNNCLNIAMKRKFYLTFKMLIDAGTNINHINNNGDTPLMFVLKNNINNLYFTKLLEAGADVNIVNKDGKTVLDIANELNNNYCINKLEQLNKLGTNYYIDKLKKDPYEEEKEAFYYEKEDPPDYRDPWDGILYGIDCSNLMPTKVEFDIARGKYKNYDEKKGKELFVGISEMKREWLDDINYIKNLLLNGASMDIGDINGNNSLNISMKKNFYCIFHMLIKAGVDVNHINKNGDNSLMFALKHNIDEFYIEKLLEAGANVNHVNKNGNTPLIFALKYCDHSSGIDKFIEAGADINHINKKGNTPLIITLYDKYYRTNGNKLKFAKLLEAGADTSIVNAEGKTVLDIARELDDNYYIDKLKTKPKQKVLKR